jgi:hypothetical protein
VSRKQERIRQECIANREAWELKLLVYCCMGGKHDWALGHHFDAAWTGCLGWGDGWWTIGSKGGRGGFRTKQELLRPLGQVWRRCTP